MIKRIFFHSPVRYIVGTALAAVITVICLIIKGFEYRMSYVDAFSIAGGAVFFIGLLQLVSFLGAFDIFSFSFSFFRGKDRRYKDYLSYQENRAEKKKFSDPVYIPFIVVGVVFTSIGMVLYSVLIR